MAKRTRRAPGVATTSFSVRLRLPAGRHTATSALPVRTACLGQCHSEALRAAGRLRQRRGNGRVQHGMTRMRATRTAVQRDLAGMKIQRPLLANQPLPACQGQQRLVDWRQAEIRRLVFAVVRRASSVTAREK